MVEPDTTPLAPQPPTEKPNLEEGTEPPPAPLPLSADQKTALKEGLDTLGRTLSLGKADIAKLAHAKASGNDAHYFYQLGKLDIPPDSSVAEQLKTGLAELFAQIQGDHSLIAKEIQPTLVLDDVSRLATSKAINLPASLVVDLGALTHNEVDRFIALAEATGVPQKKAEHLLRGLEAVGKRYDLSTSELDALLGDAARTVNTELSVEMNKAAKTLNLSPPLFNDLANAVVTKDSAAFAAIGEKEGLSKAQLKEVLPEVSRSLTEIGKSPVISLEKLRRFTKDTSIQNQIFAAGKEYGLTQPQSLKLAAAYVDTDLSGYVKLAEEYGLGKNASKLLNKLEEIETRQGTNALSLATNNFPEIVEQRVLARELGLQSKPVDWPTTTPAPFKPPLRGPFDFLGKVGGIMPPPDTSKADEAARAEAAAKTKNEVRFVKLFDELRHAQGEIKKLDEAMRNPFFQITHPQARDRLTKLQNHEHNIRAELNRIQEAGHAPSPQRAQEIKLLDQLGNLKEKLLNLEGMMKRNPFIAVFHRPAADILKGQIQGLETQLKQLRD
ncbi:hypothetical protein [Sansalvadorimonas verongulae]|uniref:hypothetical protein n=1 Tax=Sansalvadorimonas verongulae TaxID=2172824 RepID=UPI0012BCD922|nr:hypothetical protein [Sansalvadorimonas verongulae]MTI15521.1 hypothetical protein [Sansalvadorimonas verongulae]